MIFQRWVSSGRARRPAWHSMCAVLISFALTSVPASVSSQEFWRGTRFGDPVGTVKNRVPAASNPVTSASLRGRGIEQLMDAPASIAGRSFRASFQFSKRGLDRVILISTENLSDSEADAVFGAVSEALKLKYGPAIRTADPGRSVLEDEPFWLMWSSADTEITLMERHHKTPMLISYQLSDSARERHDRSAAERYRKSVRASDVAKDL